MKLSRCGKRIWFGLFHIVLMGSVNNVLVIVTPHVHGLKVACFSHERYWCIARCTGNLYLHVSNRALDLTVTQYFLSVNSVTSSGCFSCSPQDVIP